MGRSMQWLSLAGGIAMLLYGIYKLLAFPQPDWIPMILGLLIAAFSISWISRNSGEKESSDRSKGP